ncbi:hypothetical protein PFICI_00440 [Pestalotiopsis fici W106-1]|uniref:Uncharacterized protein n=1 Tax=Pestalotiopsis fici (strain W106-1 / CGMCC3.15140) TaxID=1229662 RepID=W3XM98_PESFW|nr:uncharacterized protein PFICI_00440 [Pestalotiopsis fici W106-1]ETS86612.1 hypothetical protein PFICI_00440 [Pestalotiopsis fici W106-1]
MALTIKHLNSDASFLLSFEPVGANADPARGPVAVSRPFTILLDPWLTGPSNIFHPKFSTTTQTVAPCVSSLAELSVEPDLVIISQPKSDHCNEATLRQLPASGTRTLILAEPASARLIRSWKYFDREKVRTIESWKDPRTGANNHRRVFRIPVPAAWPGGQTGEVTVCWIPQKRDLSGVHGAIGITYRPPPSQNNATVAAAAVRSTAAVVADMLTPPATPVTPVRTLIPPTSVSTTHVHLFPPSPPISPHSLRSVQSAAALISPATPNTPQPRQSLLDRYLAMSSSSTSSSPTTQDIVRPISLVFSPHGIAYADLAPWATSHLVAEAALPLTALLHCMDSIANPWWLGGNVCWGTATGAEIARRLGARVWISAHDAEKQVRGLATGRLTTRRWGREEIAGILGNSHHRHHHHRHDAAIAGYRGQDEGQDVAPSRQGKAASASAVRVDKEVEILRLDSGDEVLVTGNGHVLHDCFSQEVR